MLFLNYDIFEIALVNLDIKKLFPDKVIPINAISLGILNTNSNSFYYPFLPTYLKG